MTTQNPENALDTHAKALKINLDNRFYGTLAEIGAGQEVVRWFFRVGGAAGTLAKTISAYDMTFSDAIYGKGERYVSRARLQNMLDYEMKLLNERLGEKRGPTTSFFVFADTVSARNYLGTNECHGWLGIKFQSEAEAHPSEIIIHVNMLDKSNLQQQPELVIEHVLQARLADVALALAVDRVGKSHVVGRDRLGQRARRAPDPEEPARHLLPRPNFGKRSVKPLVEVDLDGFLVRCDGRRVELFHT